MAVSRGVWQHGNVPKRRRDPAQLAKRVFDIAVGEAEEIFTCSVHRLRSEGCQRKSRSKTREHVLRGATQFDHAHEHEALYSPHECI